MNRCKISCKKLMSLILGLMMLSGMSITVVNARGHCYYLVNLNDGCIKKISILGVEKSVDIAWYSGYASLCDAVERLVGQNERVYIEAW